MSYTKCYYHPENITNEFCDHCHKPICERCKMSQSYKIPYRLFGYRVRSFNIKKKYCKLCYYDRRTNARKWFFYIFLGITLLYVFAIFYIVFLKPEESPFAIFFSFFILFFGIFAIYLRIDYKRKKEEGLVEKEKFLDTLLKNWKSFLS